MDEIQIERESWNNQPDEFVLIIKMALPDSEPEEKEYGLRSLADQHREERVSVRSRSDVTNDVVRDAVREAVQLYAMCRCEVDEVEVHSCSVEERRTLRTVEVA